jgi:NAD(P)-dependent dehydrogenase (short-subunit alcohol dehydrogenase family)
MGYNMAINLFTKSLTAGETSPTSEVNALTGKVMSAPARGSTGRPPAFVVCDVNEDAVKAVMRNIRDKFPDVDIVFAKSPAE